ncbi:hypothetical protein PLESTF_001388400 [Pleodorina starrii]|nr:hypothetical protein PLESTF_001388400 [Pleodorina starrii]
MTVSPRYAAYPGVFDTGLLAPVETNAGRSAAAAGQNEPSSTAPEPRPAAATEVSYARYYVCNDRGVLRVFVDHPIFGAAAGSTGSLAAAATDSARNAHAQGRPFTAADSPRPGAAASPPPQQQPGAIAGNNSSGDAVASTAPAAAAAATTVGCGGANARCAASPPSNLSQGWRSVNSAAACSSAVNSSSRVGRWDPVLSELQSDGEARAAAAAAAAHGCDDPSLGVYTYCEGDGGLAHRLDLQARNNVLCQAALAAPVLLWHDPSSMPPELRLDLSKGASGPSGYSLPPEALPFVLRNGIAEPSITLEPGAAERLRTILGLNRRAHTHPTSSSSSSYPSSSSSLSSNRTSLRAGRAPSRAAAASAGGAVGQGWGKGAVAAGGESLGGAAADAAATVVVPKTVQQQPHQQQQPQQQQVLFVGNDWPSALLPLWLQTYREVLSSASNWNALLQARLRQLDAAYGPVLAGKAPLQQAVAAPAPGAPAADPAGHPGDAAVAATAAAAPSLIVGADDEIIAATLSARTAEAAVSGAAAPTLTLTVDNAAAAAAAAAAAGSSAVSGGYSTDVTSAPVRDGTSAAATAAAEPSRRDAPCFGGDGQGNGLQLEAPPASAAVATATVVLEPPQACDAAAADEQEDDQAGDEVMRTRGRGDLDAARDRVLVHSSGRGDGGQDSQGSRASGDSAGAWPAPPPAAAATAAAVPVPLASPKPAMVPPQAAAAAMALVSPQVPAVAHAEEAGAVPAVAQARVGGAPPTPTPGDDGPASADSVGLVWEEQSRQEALLLQLVYTLNAITMMPGGLGSGGGGGSGQPTAAPAASVEVAAPHALPTPHSAEQQEREPEEQTQAAAAAQQQVQGVAAAAADDTGDGNIDVDDPQEARMRRTLQVFRTFVGSRLQGSKTVLAVHNFAFQGLFSADTFWRLGLPLFALQQMLLGPGANASTAAAPPPAAVDARALIGGPDHGNDADGGDDSGRKGPAQVPPSPLPPAPGSVRFVSWLKGALLSSDALVTVSPGYARELTAKPPPPPATAGRPAFPPPPPPGLPAAGGPELRDIVSSRGIRAIMNGLDDECLWNPAVDPLLPEELRFDAATAAAGKARAKAALQTALGLEADPDVPLFGFVGRLEAQKGADVVLAALPQLLGPPEAAGGYGYNRSLGYDRAAADAAAEQARRGSAARRRAAAALQSLLRRLGLGAVRLPWRRRQPPPPPPPAAADAAGTSRQAQRQQPQPPHPRRLQVAMLGTGRQWLQDGLAALPRAYPGRAAGVVGFDEPLCHLLMAGCDFLLVPSRWEPCGLVAMAAQRYGAVPLVAPTGGLLDAILAPTADGRAEAFAGLVMDEAVGAEDDPMATRRAAGSLVRAVGAACELYDGGRASYEALRVRCMARDVSWEGPARQWEELLAEVAEGDGGGGGGLVRVGFGASAAMEEEAEGGR